MPSASASAFIVDAVPIVLQCPGDGAEDATSSMNSSWSISPAASRSRAFQMIVPDPVRSPPDQPFSIGPPDSTIDGMFTVAAAIRQAGAAGGQHDAVDGVAVERLDQAEVREVAIQRGGWPLAGLLDRVHRELDRDPAGLPDAFANPLGQLQVMAVARGEIRAGLRDADDRLAGLKLVAGEAPVQVPLEVEGGHPGVGGVVEPGLAAQGHRITVPLRRPGRKTKSAGDHAWGDAYAGGIGASD